MTSVMHAPKPSALIPGSLSALSFNPNKSNPSPNRSGSAEQIVRVIEDLGEQQLEEQDPSKLYFSAQVQATHHCHARLSAKLTNAVYL